MTKEKMTKVITTIVMACSIVVIFALTACCVALAIKFITWLL